MSLGEQIREQRIKKGMSQEKLAEQIGVSRQAVAKWESGQSAPNTENLFKLAQICGISVDHLMSHQAQRTESSVAEELFHLHQMENDKRKRVRREKFCRNGRYALLVLLGYGIIYISGRIPAARAGEYSVLGWPFSQEAAGKGGYLYGWLCNQGIIVFCGLISVLLSFFGRYRAGFVTLTGFGAGLVLGEILGKNPDGASLGFGHYGWAIWGGIFLLSAVMGMILERMSRKGVLQRSKEMAIWRCLFLFGIAAVILFVRGNF